MRPRLLREATWLVASAFLPSGGAARAERAATTARDASVSRAAYAKCASSEASAGACAAGSSPAATD